MYIHSSPPPRAGPGGRSRGEDRDVQLIFAPRFAILLAKNKRKQTMITQIARQCYNSLIPGHPLDE